MNIKFDYDGIEYTLEYSKQAVRMMENQGFSVENLSSKPTTTIPTLFKGAFYMHHKDVKVKKIDEIYSALEDKADLILALTELYMDAVNSVLEGDSPEDGSKKVKWTKNE